jgi:hypothetical protein
MMVNIIFFVIGYLNIAIQKKKTLNIKINLRRRK